MREETSSSPLRTAADFLTGVAGRVIIAALLILLLFEGVRTSFSFGHAIFYQEPVEAAPGTDHVLTLPQDVSISDVASLLKEEGIIRNELAFVIQGELYQTTLYPGEYTFNTSMTTKELLEKLNTDAEEKKALAEAANEAAAGNADDSIVGGGDEADGEVSAENAAQEGADAASDGNAGEAAAGDAAGGEAAAEAAGEAG